MLFNNVIKDSGLSSRLGSGLILLSSNAIKRHTPGLYSK